MTIRGRSRANFFFLQEKKNENNRSHRLRKSLKDLSDHLNFFVSCQDRSQLSPAIFRASRKHLVASKHSYMLQLSNPVINVESVQVNMAYDLTYKRTYKVKTFWQLFVHFVSCLLGKSMYNHNFHQILASFTNFKLANIIHC